MRERILGVPNPSEGPLPAAPLDRLLHIRRGPCHEMARLIMAGDVCWAIVPGIVPGVDPEALARLFCSAPGAIRALEHAADRIDQAAIKVPMPHFDQILAETRRLRELAAQAKGGGL